MLLGYQLIVGSTLNFMKNNQTQVNKETPKWLPCNPVDVKSVADLDGEVRKVLKLGDDGWVMLICASVIAHLSEGNPVWMMFVAPSASGKSETIGSLIGLDFIHEISDLTVNSLASGFKAGGVETSLLHKMDNGIMMFKDFTSILSKGQEAKKEIMKQLREVYDGRYNKRTGNNADVLWEGKIGAIAASTEAIYSQLADMSAMGDRFIMYSVKQPERIEGIYRAWDNEPHIKEMREHLKACFSNYINYTKENLEPYDIVIPDDIKDTLIEIADFAAQARSGVLTDFKTGNIDFVPAPEMGMRIIGQLRQIATAFIIMNRADPRYRGDYDRASRLTELQISTLHRVAFDSIPRTRRNALISLATYDGGVSTAGFATSIGLQTTAVKKYLEQVNALGICDRVKKGGKQGDQWKLRTQYRDIIIRLEGIKPKEGMLISEEAEEDEDEDWYDNYIKNEADQGSLDPENITYDKDDEENEADLFNGF